jgi:HlyD family secretion protein
MRPLAKYATAILVLLIAPALFWFSRRQTPVRAAQNVDPGALVLLASSGRVEGRGETTSVGAAADGVVESVLVTEGQQVVEGAALAAINCDDIKEEIERADAETTSARQARIRLLRGRRPEERQASAQKTAAAKAVWMQAQEHFNRITILYQKDGISADLFDQAKRDYEVAQANYQNSRDELDLVNAAALPEEKAKADADVTAAEKNVGIATDKLEKCTIRAPISGTVLRILIRQGESYSTLLPRPLFELADDSIRRVRAEVDEKDVGKVKVGQRAMVTADGFPGRQFEGHVVELAHVMGRKSVLSGDPAEKADRDVLEAIIELGQPALELPIGLRVTAQFY